MSQGSHTSDIRAWPRQLLVNACLVCVYSTQCLLINGLYSHQMWTRVREAQGLSPALSHLTGLSRWLSCFDTEQVRKLVSVDLRMDGVALAQQLPLCGDSCKPEASMLQGRCSILQSHIF